MWRTRLRGARAARQVRPGAGPGFPRSVPWLPYRALHLELDEPVQLHRVLERKLLGERLDEAVDDHRLGLGACYAAAHEVEELLVGHLADRRLVAEGHVLRIDVVVRVRVRARVIV